MSNLSQFFSGGGVKSIQTGYVNTATTSTGTGEDARFLNVTISSVNTAKAYAWFVGGWAASEGNATLKSVDGVGIFECLPRLTSSTNLRLSSNRTEPGISGRWYVVEFA